MKRLQKEKKNENNPKQQKKQKMHFKDMKNSEQNKALNIMLM